MRTGETTLALVQFVESFHVSESQCTYWGGGGTCVPCNYEKCAQMGNMREFTMINKSTIWFLVYKQNTEDGN